MRLVTHEVRQLYDHLVAGLFTNAARDPHPTCVRKYPITGFNRCLHFFEDYRIDQDRPDKILSPVDPVHPVGYYPTGSTLSNPVILSFLFYRVNL